MAGGRPRALRISGSGGLAADGRQPGQALPGGVGRTPLARRGGPDIPGRAARQGAAADRGGPGRAQAPGGPGARRARGADRLFLGGVRTDRGPADLRRRPRRPRRRPPEVRERPGCAADGRRPLLPGGVLPPGRQRRRHAERGLPGARARRAAALDRRDARREPSDRHGGPRRADRAPAHPHRQGRPRAAAPARHEPARERGDRPRNHRAPVRRRVRDAAPAGDRARHRRPARPREARPAADDPAHQRGARRLRLARADPASRAGGAPLLRRGARGGDDRQHLHDPHARARGHRRVLAGAPLEVLRRVRQRARHHVRRALRARPGSGRPVARALLDGGPRDAALDAPERGVAPPRGRLAQALAGRHAGSAALGSPDQADHQRRARADVDGARDRGDGGARAPRGRGSGRAVAGARGAAGAPRDGVPREARRGEAPPGRAGRGDRGGRARPRSEGADDRLCAPLRDLQARDAALPRAQAARVPAPPDRPARADPVCRQGASARRGRKGIPPDRRAGGGAPGVERPRPLPARLRHGARADPRRRLRRLAEHARAPARGVRDVGHEGRDERCAEPLGARRMVGRGAARRGGLRHRRGERPGGGRGDRAGPVRRDREAPAARCSSTATPRACRSAGSTA